VRNPKYAELGLEPMEMRIRRELGTVLPLDRVAEAPQRAAELLRGAAQFRTHSAALRDAWAFNVGRSVEVGAREIARIADERAGAGASGAALHAGRRRGGEK
jgi:YidC/Oxa1 family membrane protein insertase